VIRASCGDGADTGEEWLMLDRIIASALEWAEWISVGKIMNGEEITFKMHDHKRFCQYTHKLFTALFSDLNNGRRAQLENMGITFLGKKRWDEIKICVKRQRGHPELHKRFYGEAVALQRDQNIGQGQPPPALVPAHAVQPEPVDVPDAQHPAADAAIIEAVAHAIQTKASHIKVQAKNGRFLHWYKVGVARAISTKYCNCLHLLEVI
jgi:hypothetical protein